DVRDVDVARIVDCNRREDLRNVLTRTWIGRRRGRLRIARVVEDRSRRPGRAVVVGVGEEDVVERFRLRVIASLGGVFVEITRLPDRVDAPAVGAVLIDGDPAGNRVARAGQ